MYIAYHLSGVSALLTAAVYLVLGTTENVSKLFQLY